MKKQLVIILKNPGTSCNIGCSYCAEERKKYVSVENYITEDQIKKIAILTKDYSLNVLFHGGEPTLLDCSYYERAMDFFEKENTDVYFGMQTNATRIDEEWISFLKRNKERLGISVSLDGPNDINKFRLTKDKEETYDLVYNNIKKLERNNIKTGMICTIISNAIGKEKELFNMLRDFKNLLFVKLNPCMDRNCDGTIPFWAVTPKQYFEFVSNFFDIMIRESSWNDYFLEPVISILKRMQGVDSAFCNYSKNKCYNFISIYPDGTITSCDNYNLQEGYLGNINTIDRIDLEELRNSNKALLDSYTNLLDKCAGCDEREICTGGCIAVRRRYNDSDEYCVGMKKMINHIRGVYKYVK